VTFDPALLEILACPNDRGVLEVAADGAELVCTSCRYAYPVRDGIPVLLVDEARVPGGDASAAAPDAS
jgi:uncharacterized protein YbaR (Trm112 family)